MTTLRFAAVVGLLSLHACASVEKVVVAEPGVAFSLPIGKAAAVSGSASRLTFSQVREDSRCPLSVVCVWEGDAKIEVALSRNGSAGESATLSLKPPNNEARIEDLIVRFVGLSPYPATPEPAAPRQYVAELVIRRL